MGHAPTPAASPRARALDAVLAPLLELFESAAGMRAAFMLEFPEADATVRYAFAAGDGLVESRAARRAAVPADTGLRLALALQDGRGADCGHLEATSLAGRPFPDPARAALRACARVLEAHLAAHAFPRPGDAGTALLDASTGLPNRSALLAELERMLARAQRDDMTVFAVCIGLAGLDEQAASARFEREVGALAACLAESVRGGDLVARTGAHEFVVVGSIPRATAEASAAVVLERLHARCAGRAGAARIDIGLAIGRIGEYDPRALLAEAEDSLLA